jgi:hypothetical protein
MTPVLIELKEFTNITKVLLKYNTDKYRTMAGEHNFTNNNEIFHIIFIYATDLLMREIHSILIFNLGLEALTC